MEYKLDDSHEKYLKMTVLGTVGKAGLVSAIAQLMNHPDYPDKHSLWDLSDSTMGLSIGDLREIAEFLSFYKPKEAHFANKSAIVVPGQMHKAMVNLFIKMANRLPFNYYAFNHINEAEQFLCEE